MVALSKDHQRKIINPYIGSEGYHCFGCSPDNPQGLKMEFYEEGEMVVCHWIPVHHFGGYKNVLHGGIQATLLDEIAAWTVQVKLRTAGVTASIDLKYKRPVFTDKGNLLLKAFIEKVEKQIVFVKTELYDHQHKLCCEGIVKYFIYPEKIAREKLYYRDFEEFFNKKD
jgi:uncharacterized protein (TIGR00369 family)